jgi:hypothetical protein
MQGAQKKDLRWKKRQPENTRGSKERPMMKKELTPKRKGLKRKTSDEKIYDFTNKNQEPLAHWSQLH